MKRTAERLIDFYKKQPEPKLSVIWINARGTYHKDIIDALESEDVDAVDSVLSNMWAGRATFGLDSSGAAIANDFPPNKIQEGVERLILSSANCLGLLPVRNLESSVFDTPNVGDVINEIENHLDFKISYSTQKGMNVASIGGRDIPHMLASAVNLVCSAEIQKRISSECRVMELGAGLGWVGYVLVKLGVCLYETVDLPSTSVMQAYMLSKSIGSDSVWLSGEPDSPNIKVRINGLSDPVSEKFDLIINQNSFPEIENTEQERYVDLIYDRLAKDGVFLSFNHESRECNQRRVFDVMSKDGRFTLEHRSIPWSRTHYVQEVWSANK